MTLLHTIETYYDAAPRPMATTEEIGPFTLFVKTDPEGWPFYARPRLGLDRPVGVEDVEALRARQRKLGVPESIEWVHEITPSLLPAAREAGLVVRQCPLLVLERSVPDRHATGTGSFRVMVLDPGSLEIGPVVAAVSAGFAGTDDVVPREPGRQADLIRDGLLALVGAFDEGGVLGGGSHSPRGTTTELAGIAVLPRARKQGVGAAVTSALVEDAAGRGVETIFLSAQDDAVARVYERVGFGRIGTACTAEPADRPV